jgi:hypothetical protein
MIIKDNSLSIKSILISLLNVECNSLGWWSFYQLDQLALPIAVRCFFGMLQVHSWVNMSQLNLWSVVHLFAMLQLDPLDIVNVLLHDSFLKHLELIINQLVFIDRLSAYFTFLINCYFIHFSSFLSFPFPLIFSHWIISKLWDNLENHVTDVWHLGRM